MDFLWHKVFGGEKEDIKKQAKSIIDSFSEKLSKVKKMPESLIEREKGERQEGQGKSDENFSREIMFNNAPDKDKDFIISEKKEW